MTLKRRDFISLSSTAALAATLTACGNSGTADSGGGQRFTYWSMWQQGEPQQALLAELFEAFTEKTGIQVEAQWAGREVLTQVVPRLNSGNPPDLVDQAASDFPAKLGLDNLADLTDLWAMPIDGEDITVGESIPESLMDALRTDGKIFCFPYSVAGETIFFNKRITPELAENPPQSFDDLLTYLDERKAAGRTPIALDGDIKGYEAYWLESALLRAGGRGIITEAAQDATGEKFGSKPWVDATEAIGALIAGDYFPEGFQGTKFPTQQASFADQSTKTDMILMGTWLPSEASSSLEKSGDDPGSVEWGSFKFPAVGDNAGAGIAISGPTGFAIPIKARNQEAAKTWMAYFANKERCGRIASDAKNLTARTDIDQSSELADYGREYAEASEVVPFTDGVGVAEPQWVTDVWQPLINDFFGGKIGATQFREQLAANTVTYHGNQ